MCCGCSPKNKQTNKKPKFSGSIKMDGKQWACKGRLTVMYHSFTHSPIFKYVFNFYFLAMSVACRSSPARDWTCFMAVTRSTAVTILDTQPIEPPGNSLIHSFTIIIILLLLLPLLFRTPPEPYGHSQSRGWIRAAAGGLHHSIGNATSLTHWASPGIKPESSRILVKFITTETQ